jgi:1-deoxy-D-xylulose-5-phosphate synthase
MLETLTGPEGLRALPASALPALAEEIRQVLIESVPRTGGHFGPNLGVVELTIALHRVFHSPHDAIVWDTGHQAYVHKLLTGRRDGFATLRSAGGLSGYPSRAESAHDLVENSHASTALSYADGLTRAFALRGEPDRAVVAVVGDGALTGGMCWEALNNIGGAPQRPLIIVLNDNGRSYSPTVGSLASHLSALRQGATTRSVFEQLGLAYLGPVDGHDIAAVEAALGRARELGCAVVVHCITVKGKGCPAAETDEVDCLHSVSPPAPASGLPGLSWTAVFSDELLAIARERPDVVALTAAMLHPTGLYRFAAEFPERVFDVGIAEQHAVTTAAGLAMGGLHPVVCVYATFLNRAFDQVLMDVALHELPVTFVLDRAGVTGNDGPSHNGMWDLSLLGVVPGMRVAAPRDAARLRELFREAVEDDTGPTAMRFPKGRPPADLAALSRLHGCDVLRQGHRPDVLLVALGPLAHAGCAAADMLESEGTAVTVVDPRWVLPVPPVLAQMAADHALVVTVEDHCAANGFGDAMSRALRAAGVNVPLVTLGVDQGYLRHGDRSALLRSQGLDAGGVAMAVGSALGLDGCPASDQPNLRASAW